MLLLPNEGAHFCAGQYSEPRDAKLLLAEPDRSNAAAGLHHALVLHLYKPEAASARRPACAPNISR